MAARVRRNVFDLGERSPELEWYGKAVADLMARPLDDPTGWRYRGAVHGRMDPADDPFATPADRDPADKDVYWDQCQHQTWFFLPWHRGYLAAFEANVARSIERLGGPKDWALPYWNYSTDAASRIMPRDFFEEKRPDGSANPLWNPWTRHSDGNSGFSNRDVSIECLTHAIFAGTNDGGETGFAGPVSGFEHFGQLQGLPSGRVEEAPHNQVHGRLGGLMGDPNFAALDPIFWLHHANIDRLWEVWRKTWPQSATPTDPNWLNRTTFDMHDGAGQPFKFTAGEMLDTTKVLHGYTYDRIEVPAHVTPDHRLAAAAFGMTTPRRPGRAELAGANEEHLSLAGGTATTRLSVRPPPQRLGLGLTASAPLRAYLNLEQITGQGMPGNYEVFVQTTGHEPVLAGQISTFGIEKASRADGGHGGNGLSRVLDITSLVVPLGLDRGGDINLQVTIRKIAERPGLLALRDTSGDSMRVGRVSLYFA